MPVERVCHCWLVAITVAVGFGQTKKYVPPAPEQPIPFSHRVHIAKGLDCKGCHPVPEPGDFATIPETSTCMSCHRTVKKESAAIQRTTSSSATRNTLPRPEWRAKPAMVRCGS